MTRNPHSLRPSYLVLRCPLRVVVSLIALFIALAPIAQAQAQNRSANFRRDRRPSREVTIRYPASNNDRGSDRGGYIHRNGVVPTFQPGPAAPVTSPDLSDESDGRNDTPNVLEPR